MTLLQRRPDGLVVKLMSASASAPITASPTWPGIWSRHLDDYIAALRAAGVQLPADLSPAQGETRPAVQHQWLAGTPLPDLAATDPRLFTASTARVADWVTALDPAPARLDTNLANFLLTADGLTCIDVLPPLLVPLRPAPADAWQALFGALCYDTDIILCALTGYAARAALAARPAAPATPHTAAVDFCPGHPEPDALAARWFHQRSRAALAALNGALPAPAVLNAFSATSMLRLRNTPGPGRDHLVDAGLAALTALDRT